MELSNKEIGFAITGSYCTFDQVIPQIRKLKEMGAQIHPIVSENVSKTDTRFMKVEDLYEKLQCITGREIIDTIAKAEPIGPHALLDLLIVAPCTGNTVSKIALGITDTPVVMAVKAHLRNQRPVLLAISTNDALGASAKNIGALMNTQYIYFVPMSQDNYLKKAASMVAEMELIPKAAMMALDGKQLQPIYNKPKEVF
ncbi:MAG: dipicolinate synthase subunit B [Eubacteriales bacterium]